MNILIIRLSAIGDIVMSMPVAACLKAKWPKAKITWLTQPENKALLEFNPHIDQVICWDKAKTKSLFQQKKFRAALSEVLALGRKLKAAQFDLCLDMQGLMKSGLMAWLSGAKRKVGLGSKEGSQWLMDEVLARNLGDTTLISSEYRSLVEYLECHATYELKLYPGAGAKQRAIEIIQDQIQAPYLVICPFTTRPQKHWFADHWVALVARLTAMNDTKVVMLGGPCDVAAAASIQHPKLINLVGQTRLPEAAALIEQAQAVVGVDTGLTHMGHAAKVPTVALFGSTVPYLHTGLTSSQVIYLNLECSPCRRNPTCGGRFECLRDITPQSVEKTLNHLLKEAS